MNEGITIIIDFSKENNKPIEIFAGIANMMKALTVLNKPFADCIDVKLDNPIILDRVEEGSIKIKIKSFFTGNKDIPNGSEKQVKVVSYLNKCMDFVLNCLGHDKFASTDDIGDLELRFKSIIEESGINDLGLYAQPSMHSIISAVDDVNESIKSIGAPVYIESEFGKRINISKKEIKQEVLDTYLKSSTRCRKVDAILHVKNAIFIGRAQWEFQLAKNSISATIQDEEWLSKYQNGKIDLKPGDALMVRLNIIATFNERQKPKFKYEILKVNDVVHESEFETNSLFEREN